MMNACRGLEKTMSNQRLEDCPLFEPGVEAC